MWKTTVHESGMLLEYQVEGARPVCNSLSMVESPYDGNDETPLQRQQLGTAQARRFT